ncbi:unnamed protein product [Rhodiola kirilowii]
MSTDANTIAIIPLSSPYYLHPSDHPGLSICPVILKDDNYDEWVIAMRNSLRAKRKLGFLDGSLSCPDSAATSPPTLEDWYMVNSMLVSWIVQSIDPSLRSSITYFDSVKDLWDDLRQRFSIGNGPRKLQLRSEIARYRQTGQTVAAYYNGLKKLWDELLTYVPTRNCTCGQCKCNLNSFWVQEREEERVHQFLMGLDDVVFGTLRSNIMAQDPLPPLNKVYSLVIQEERLKTVVTSREFPTDSLALAARSHSKSANSSSQTSSSQSRKTFVCSHCGKKGHDKTSCYKLIGFPDWLKEKITARKQASESSFPNDAPLTNSSSKERSTGYANAINNSGGSMAASPMTASDRPAFGSTLSDEQWTAVMNMFNSMQSVTEKSGMISSWIIDTGASYHMTGDAALLRNITNVDPVSIKLPDGRVSSATKKGCLYMSNFRISHVLLVPQLSCNLLSFAQLAHDLHLLVLLTDKFVVLQEIHTRIVIGVGKQQGGVYWLQNLRNAASAMSAQSCTSSATLWHRRLGHPSSTVLSSISELKLDKNSMESIMPCESCFKAKQTRHSFPISSSKAAELFQLVHCDVWGPYSTPSFSGASYFLTIVDDYSRAVWVYFCVAKSEIALIFKNFVALVDTQYHKRIQRVRADNGTEFLPLRIFFDAKGIIFETSCVATPQQNGRVERKHRHLLNVARALRFQAHLPLQFWAECVSAAAFIINHTPSPNLGHRTPYELLHNRVPSYNSFRVFGCLCFASQMPRSRDKFAPRSRKCIFIGYPSGKHGWRLYDLETKESFISRDVVFFETFFPFATPSIQPPTALESTPSPAIYDDPPYFLPQPATSTHSATLPPTEVRESPLISPSPPSDPEPSDPEPPAVRRSTRTRQPNVRLQDYECNTIQLVHPLTASSSPTPESQSSGIRYPLAAYVSCSNFSDSHVHFLAAVTAGAEPSSFKAAVQHRVWREAMNAELEALRRNSTWTLSLLPPGKTSIGCKWVYRIKYKSNGAVERHKARLVILGNRQVEGVDYTETFAPVAKMTSVRVFLSVAIVRGWELHQMDVHNAFLHGDLDEEVYMRPPPGLADVPPGHVCRLQKSLYGLKQAPRNWFAKLSSALCAFGFCQSKADYSLFSYKKQEVILHVLVYVDDLIVAGNNSTSIARFKSYLNSCFHMKDLGVLKYFLGIEISRLPSGLFLSQRKYTLDILSEVGLLAAKPCGFPMEQHHQLVVSTSPPLSDPERYRRLVGRLIYLTITRPELSYSVHTLAQFMQNPKSHHWHAALRVLHYLKGHPGQGLLLSAQSSLQLTAFCDSDWASCPITRRSISGYFIMLGKSPISWKTKKQTTISRSSVEAEYRSMASTCCELVWLKSLLHSLGVGHNSPMRLYCDSQAALHIAANPVFHERTKHIEIDCHLIRDYIQSGTIITSYIPTTQQPADLFTKALGKVQFQLLLGKLGIIDPHAPT